MIEPLRELRLASRKLARTPLFTAVAVLSLGIGIGANSAVFSVVDGVLLEPLPYREPEQLVRIVHTAPGLGASGSRIPMSDAMYFTYRAENRAFQDLGLAEEGPATITGASAPERVVSLVVTDGTLSLLGATLALGRGFRRADDAPGAPPTVILSHGYWRRRFGGRAEVIGQSLVVDGAPHVIVGVLPRSFRVLEHDPAIYLPARLDPANTQPMSLRYLAIGRLRPGVPVAEARHDLERLVPVAFERYPSRLSLDQLRRAGFAPAVRPLRDDVVGDVDRTLYVLLGTVALVLLLACANVANLFLVRIEARQREVALHAALGAEQRRIVAGFLTESFVLSTLGGVLGIAVAYGGLELLAALAPRNLPRIAEIGIDGRVLAFTAVVSLLAGCLFGVFPAFRYGRRDLASALRQGSAAAGTSAGWARARSGLVAVQVALALVLLIGSGLMVRSVRSLQQVDPGFARPEEVTTFTLFFPEAEVVGPERLAMLHREILDRLRRLPGVTEVGGARAVPMSGAVSNAPIRIEGRPADPGRMPAPRRHAFITPGYREALLARLVAGRTFSWSDLDAGLKVVLVSENLARDEWGSPEAALGKRIALAGGDAGWHEIVGVLGNVREDGVALDPPAMAFWPMSGDLFQSQAGRSLAVMVRAPDGDPGLIPRVQRAVWAVNPNLPVADVRTLKEIVDGSMARAAFTMVMLSLAAAVGLILGIVGVYGVISYVVSQRTREIGVRIALGARPRDVGLMVVGQAAVVTGVGVAAGLTAAAGLTRLMTGLLHGIRPLDPVTYGSVTLGVVAVALAASYFPARRAAAIAPMTALRSD